MKGVRKESCRSQSFIQATLLMHTKNDARVVDDNIISNAEDPNSPVLLRRMARRDTLSAHGNDAFLDDAAARDDGASPLGNGSRHR